MRHAFTLIELLVSTTIIAVLITLGCAGYQRVMISAYATVSVNNLRQLTIANNDYAVDHEHYAPASNAGDNWYWCGKQVGAEYDPTKGFLADYLGKDRRVTADPLFVRQLKSQGKVSSFSLGCGGYGYNTYLGGMGNWVWSAEYSDWISAPMSVGQVRKLATTVMFGTTALAKAKGVQEYPFLVPPYWTDDEGNPSRFLGRPTPSLHFRFNGKALVSWCDGHVSYEKMEDRAAGYNPYGGSADQNDLGWFGPDENNGYWNPSN
ncbi:MAG: type II secretion system GspH family protein [Verrucomicrobiales bacterium]|jgi:prepilin-type N-terminal cleavage/methylation domain-containing protein/prepilin-type processing-associated H-X9-DG protein|nr:type II secretion system GspH family protein [Verrucomicrobiales bacterium]